MEFLHTHTADEDFQGKPWKRLVAMLRPDRKDIGYIYVYAIFNGLVGLSLPLGIQAIIGIIMGGASISTAWIVLVVVVLLAMAVSGALQVMQLYITETLQQRIFTRSSFEFAYRIPLFKSEYLNKYYPPELINRFFDTLNIQKGLPKILIDFSSSAIQILFGLMLLAFYHPFFVFFGLLLLFLLVTIFRITGPRGLDTSLSESKYKYRVAYWLEEMARTMSTFKLTGLTGLPLRKTDGLVSCYLEYRKKHFKVLMYQYGWVILFKILITAGLLILGSVLVLEQEINIGQFVAAEIVILIVINSVEKLILSMETIYDVLTAAEKIGTVTDLPIEGQSGIPFSQLDDAEGMQLQLQGLSYQYEFQKGPCLKNINMEVQAGERICITGYNGSGKSTLVNLISGLMTNYNGTLAYNGIPQGNYEIRSLRNAIGDVLAQEDLFEGTVHDNICMGKENISPVDIRWAAESLGLMSYIRTLKDGFDTPVVAEGRSFPRSISRKIKLARAVASRPKLLVIEEFMHNLERSEREQIADFLTDRNIPWTVVGVSNDAVYASKCDRIFIMRDGEIIDSGTFEEVRQKPYYEELFQ